MQIWAIAYFHVFNHTLGFVNGAGPPGGCCSQLGHACLRMPISDDLHLLHILVDICMWLMEDLDEMSFKRYGYS
ncbi:hypothetical protein KP509_19G037800 [Ceratopteris richardii]|uniref:Uncharacterized protein n=1 Tax=Ceratopteris richardii TaxID=49495 RepID=A0A8T2SN29_CERRI|nr:hypothetical protein KP509_19G037800 [Ceratopteris richardii]